ncbi:type II toxin-antitoxin system VapC family toxin [Rhizobium sp. 12,4]|uniref:type II toxin-antitoxin system VapC family toxin n=1 Tax=Rhizobium sp. 12,4 TaxID=3405135 RepID=UPI003D353830
MKHQPPEVARRFAECKVGDVLISAITFAELEYGVAVSANPELERTNLEFLVEAIPVAPFDADAARAYGPVREATRDRKKDHLDKPIAAHALALNDALVTYNERNFLSYPELRVENWLQSH